MLSLLKSFVLLSLLFIFGVLIGAIYTPELIVQTKSMMDDHIEKPVLNKRTKPAKRIQLV